MDLFSLVAERLEDHPPKVRPRLLTPFEEQTPDLGFQEQDSEFEAVLPQPVIAGVSEPYEHTVRETSLEASHDSPATKAPLFEVIPVREAHPVTQVVPERIVDRSVVTEKEIHSVHRPSEKVEGPTVPTASGPIERSIHAEPLLTNVPPAEPVEIFPEPSPMVAASPLPPAIPPLANSVHQHFELTEVVIGAAPTNERNLETKVEREVLTVPAASAPIEVVVEQNLLNQAITQSFQPHAKPIGSQPLAQSRSDTVIDIQIGRIEVNAARPLAPAPPRTPRPNPSRLSLDEVLKRRGS